MTRWIVSHHWKMSMQISPECTLATTFKADGKFFKQILRWTRNTWRSDYKSLVTERDIWYRYPVQVRLPPTPFNTCFATSTLHRDPALPPGRWGAMDSTLGADENHKAS